MKKAKIMLSAIAILAVVGGAFAFKANRTQLFYFARTTIPQPACVLVGVVDPNLSAPTVSNVYTTLLTTTTSYPIGFCNQTARITIEQ
jgi:hypothetical protein